MGNISVPLNEPLPTTSSFSVGVFVPSPSLLFVLSQNSCVLFCESTPLAPMNSSDPFVPFGSVVVATSMSDTVQFTSEGRHAGSSVSPCM